MLAGMRTTYPSGRVLVAMPDAPTTQARRAKICEYLILQRKVVSKVK